MWVATIAVVAGASLTAYSQYQAGKAQKAMADYNAKLAENEAIAQEQATRAETERMRSEKRRMLATQRAAYGKTGAIATEGTSLLTMAEQAGEMEKDILNMQRTGAMQAQASRSEAALSRYQGKQAKAQGIMKAGSSLLSGVAGGVSTYKEVRSS